MKIGDKAYERYMEAPCDSTELLFFPIAPSWNCRKPPYKQPLKMVLQLALLLHLMTPLYIVAKRFFNPHLLHLLHLER